MVTANSHGALQTMRAYVEDDRLAFVPNPLVRPAPSAEAPPVTAPCVLTVARLKLQKAHDVLLDAFALAGPRLAGWRLVILGRGELEDVLRVRAAALGIASRVDWHGQVSDRFPFYRAATVFALPSRYEGTPNALLEAMSCSLPVVVSEAMFYITRGEPAPLDWRARLGPETAFDALAMHWSRQVVIAVYLTAGLTKLLRSGIGWIRDAPNLALQVIKTAEQHYHARLDASHRARARATAEAILRRPALVRAALTLALLAELASPLALAGRAAGALVGIAVVGFHRVVNRYLYVHFLQLEWCVVIFVVDVPYWIARGVHA